MNVKLKSMHWNELPSVFGLRFRDRDSLGPLSSTLKSVSRVKFSVSNSIPQPSLNISDNRSLQHIGHRSKVVCPESSPFVWKLVEKPWITDLCADNLESFIEQIWYHQKEDDESFHLTPSLTPRTLEYDVGRWRSKRWKAMVVQALELHVRVTWFPQSCDFDYQSFEVQWASLASAYRQLGSSCAVNQQGRERAQWRKEKRKEKERKKEKREG